MLTFLFWNMGGSSPKKTLAKKVQVRNTLLLEILHNLTNLYPVDLLILAESPVSDPQIIKSINTTNPKPFSQAIDSNCERIRIFPRFSHAFMPFAGSHETAKLTCRPLLLPARPPLLLVAAHFGSKLHRSDESQLLSIPAISQKIREAEGKTKPKHDRTIVIGDLNMNPFEGAMVGAEGLNATMTRTTAMALTRMVDGVEYPFFYNPMWSHFGDSNHEKFPVGHASHEPAGTCYFGAKESKWYYWNMLDQVLLRPSLLHYFRNEDLKIVTTDGTNDFLTPGGRPKRLLISDHLPLLFLLHL